MVMTVVKSNVNVKIDKTVKERATQLLAHMGIDQTTAIDMFFRQIIAEKRLPFQPTVVAATDTALIALLESNKANEYTLDTDNNGTLRIDKNLHADLYDWAVNG